MGWDEGDADYTCVDTYVLYLRLVLSVGLRSMDGFCITGKQKEAWPSDTQST